MIRRTRKRRPPSGGPDKGYAVVKIGDVFVEYSGETPPDAAALAAHLSPARAVPSALQDGTGTVSRVEMNELKAYLRGAR